MADFEVRGAEKFARVAKDLKKIGDKELRKELYKGINRAVKPMKDAVKEALPDYLPDNYAKELAPALKITVRRRAGKNPSIYLVARSKTPDGKVRDLRSLNRGRLRHPLYGNRKFWYDQQVRPDWWNTPLLREKFHVQKEILKVVGDVAKKIPRRY